MTTDFHNYVGMVVVCSSDNGSTKGARLPTEMYKLVSSIASEAMGIGKSSEVLTVLGGKASCRRKFVLSVHLLDEQGSLVSRDMAIVASVAYAHDHSPVVRDEKPFLAEPPLFTTFNGVEFPAQDRPTRMASGRASFKLAISLLSSKCDNRLFCICFTPQLPPDASPLCQPCYSKPIRSISRKRTQVTSISMGPSLHGNSEGTSTVVSPPFMPRGTGNRDHTPPKSTSPASSSDNEAATTPGRIQQVQNSSRSSSVTSMHYMSPKGQRRNQGTEGQGPPALVLYENSPGQSITSNLRNHITTLDRFAGENDHHDGNGLASLSCTQLCSLQHSNMCKMPFDRSTLSLRLSPESGSPTSGALTSESCVENKDPSSRTQTSSLDGSRPINNIPSPPVNRPFRPYAAVGACKLPMTDFQLGMPESPPPFKRLLQQAASTSEGPASSHTALLERLQQLRSASPAGIKQKVEAMLQGYPMGTSKEIDLKFNGGFTEITLEEEEKSLQYIEVNLQEVSREVQRRKEELRMKRRRLMEDEARMHSIIFQSSSWIESLSRGFNL